MLEHKSRPFFLSNEWMLWRDHHHTWISCFFSPWDRHPHIWGSNNWHSPWTEISADWLTSFFSISLHLTRRPDLFEERASERASEQGTKRTRRNRKAPSPAAGRPFLQIFLEPFLLERTQRRKLEPASSILPENRRAFPLKAVHKCMFVPSRSEVWKREMSLRLNRTDQCSWVGVQISGR